MKIHEFPIKSLPTPACLQAGPLYKGGDIILALGAESAGNFSVFFNPPAPLYQGGNRIYLSPDFGDLLDEKNFKKFQKAVFCFLKINKLKPDIILTDLHPLYKTTIWGAKLAKKYSAEHVQVQHHFAHIFSVIGENILNSKSEILNPKQIKNFKFQNPKSFFGIALDGTGYGSDGKIWGGEIFQLKIKNYELKINRIGHLENQIMIGGDLAVKEPARMLLAILDKFSIFNFQFSNKPQFLIFKTKKDFIYSFIKKFYTCDQFELLYNQLQNNFNCVETSSTGRILDAVSLLLGFCKNERNYKHEPIELLEQNSTVPYDNLRPKIVEVYNKELGITNHAYRQAGYELSTIYLFEYLIKNLHKDKQRLAATAQLYIAKGIYQIILKSKFLNPKSKMFLSGGLANNKIISSYLESKGVYVHPVKSDKAGPSSTEFNKASKKIYPVKSKFNGVPRGDAGISFGQVIYYLLKK